MQRQSSAANARAIAALAAIPLEVVIQPNSLTRRWEIVLGSHHVPLKWRNDVDPMRVCRAIRRAARGPINVIVNL